MDRFTHPPDQRSCRSAVREAIAPLSTGEASLSSDNDMRQPPLSYISGQKPVTQLETSGPATQHGVLSALLGAPGGSSVTRQ